VESGYSRQTGCIVSEEGNGELTAEKNPGRCSAGGFFAADSTDWRGFFSPDLGHCAHRDARSFN
jgi:hypothetical protein